MSKIQRSLLVFVLAALFTSPVFAAERAAGSLWQEIWGTFIAYFYDGALGESLDEGGSVYVPSGFSGGGYESLTRRDEGGSVYVPSGLNGGGDTREGGSVYVPSGLGEGGETKEGGSVYVPSG